MWCIFIRNYNIKISINIKWRLNNRNNDNIYKNYDMMNKYNYDIKHLGIKIIMNEMIFYDYK